MNYTLLDLNALARAIGRAVIFYAGKWNGTGDLTLTHLCDTEGEITPSTNENFVHSTAPEVTGAAKLSAKVQGADPRFEFSAVLADPTKLAILSPTGTAGMGYSRSVPVTERTVWIVPEKLFLKADNTYEAVIAYTSAGGWTKDGQALTSDEQRLLGLSLWLWRCYFERALPQYTDADDGKSVVKCAIQVLQSDLSKNVIPEGERLLTVGDPEDASITIDLGS